MRKIIHVKGDPFITVFDEVGEVFSVLRISEIVVFFPKSFSIVLRYTGETLALPAEHNHHIARLFSTEPFKSQT